MLGGCFDEPLPSLPNKTKATTPAPTATPTGAPTEQKQASKCFDAKSNTWKSEILIGHLSIAENVTSIKPWSYYNCKHVTGLTLPPSLTVISESAFENMGRLSGPIEIPSSLTKIERNAFAGTGNITLNLDPQGAKLHTIGMYAFYNSEVTGPLVFPSSLTSISCGAL